MLLMTYETRGLICGVGLNVYCTLTQTFVRFIQRHFTYCRDYTKLNDRMTVICKQEVVVAYLKVTF
jgi:hypothetical protein